MEIKDCYVILGVNEQMTMEQIHEVYRKLCKKYHPDLFEDESEKMAAHEKFILIDSAYRTLLNKHIDDMDEKKKITHFVDIILKKMEIKMRRMDAASGQLDNIFWGSVAGSGMLIATGVLIATIAPGIGITLIIICVFGLFLMYKLRG